MGVGAAVGFGVGVAVGLGVGVEVGFGVGVAVGFAVGVGETVGAALLSAEELLSAAFCSPPQAHRARASVRDSRNRKIRFLFIAQPSGCFS